MNAMRRILFLMVFVFTGTLILAASDPADSGKPGTYLLKPFEFSRLRPVLDFIFTQLPALGAVVNDIRLSPIILMEDGFEIPLEVGFSGTQDRLRPVLDKLHVFGSEDVRLQCKSITVSVSAQNDNRGEPILTATVQHAWLTFPPEKMKVMTQGNGRVADFFGKLGDTAGFKPLIERVTGNPIANEKRVWLTNVRMDSERRLQMTGYALQGTDLTAFAEDLEKTGMIKEVFLTSANRGTFEKKPVWRFDLVARFR
jgi:hypothetical protein